MEAIKKLKQKKKMSFAHPSLILSGVLTSKIVFCYKPTFEGLYPEIRRKNWVLPSLMQLRSEVLIQAGPLSN